MTIIQKGEPMDNDYCYECRGYGDDYSFDENGDLVWNCPDCLMNPERSDDV